jgi:fatty acid desaturase
VSTEYEPLSQVRKNLKISWYRCSIDRAELKKLTRRNDLKGIYQAVGHLVLITLTGLLTYIFFNQKIWIGFSLALFVHGTIYSFISGLATHELSHGTVIKTKWLNGLFLRIFSVLGWFNFHHYKMSHTYHHLYTLHPRGDREVVLPIKPTLNPIYLFQLFTINVFDNVFDSFETIGLVPTLKRTIKLALFGKFDNEWSEAIFADQPAARKKAINQARIIVLFHLSLIIVSIVFKLWLLPVLVTFGMFTANWWRYFLAVPMHVGLRDNVPDFRLSVRTITLDPFSRFLYWHMNYHTEHHMFAAVPCYNLRKLHKIVAIDMPKPRTLVEAWREMRETWKTQKKNPSYQLDTPLPRCTEDTTAVQDPFSASLGDLAPKIFD